jgi:hypothetical protein
MNQVHIGIKAGLRILLYNPGKATYLRRKPGPRYLLDALELALGRNWKSSLDDVNAELVKLSGNSKFFVRSQ